jgi:hypothetical protein
MSLPFEGTLALRRRSPWEAADAGLLLWRNNVIFLLPFFALPFWVCAFGFRMLPENPRLWSWLALWFLKPLFDRPVLHVVSVRFFEKDSGTGRLLQGLGKHIFRGLPGDLLWRRFSPLRSVMMPLRMLEHLKGRDIRKRKRNLAKGGLYFCVFLTVWGMILEAVLLGGEILFFFIMIDMIQADYFSSLGDFFTRSEIFFFAAWCLNYILVESVYVCMGFGLYINSRVEVEGWDLEILFRKLTGGRKKKTILAGALLFCLASGWVPPVRAHAEDLSPPPGEAAFSAAGMADFGSGAPLETLREIFASGDFGGPREGWEIRLKNRGDRREPAEFDLAPWMETIRRAAAFTLRLMLILGIGGLGVFCVRQAHKHPGGKAAAPAGRQTSGRFGSPGESPESLLEKARRWYGRGDIRRAWGCCLAALLESWTRYRALCFPPEATEYECLALIRAAGAPGEAAAFTAFVNRWAALAYGGKPPPEGSFAEALDLCQSLNPAPAAEQSGAALSGHTAGGRDA